MGKILIVSAICLHVSAAVAGDFGIGRVIPSHLHMLE